MFQDASASAAITPNHWLQSAVDAMSEVATGTLGFAANDQVTLSDTIPTGQRGAFVGLVSPQNSAQIGVVSPSDGCEALARALLGFEPDEELSTADVADAVGELVNIVAGMMKNTLEASDRGLRLGLPMFIEGRIAPLEQQGTAVATLSLDGLSASVVVVYDGKP